MGYYRELRKMYINLEKIIQKHKHIDKNLLIYDLTMRFEVSSKAIINRVNLLQKNNKIDVVEGEIIWKNGKRLKED